VLVVGDVMLDRYWSAAWRAYRRKRLPVCAWIAARNGGGALMSRAMLRAGRTRNVLSVVGHDEAGANWQSCSSATCERALHRDRGISTTVKCAYSRQQQLLRVDFETTPSHEVCLRSCVSTAIIGQHDV